MLNALPDTPTDACMRSKTLSPLLHENGVPVIVSLEQCWHLMGPSNVTLTSDSPAF